MTDWTTYLEPGCGPVEFALDAFVVPDGRSLGEVSEDNPWLVEDVLRPLFSVRLNGLPRYRDCWIQQARGDGKTTSGAVFGLTSIIMNDMCEVVVAAADADQARFMAESAAGFVERSPVMTSSLGLTRDSITCPSTRSRMRIVSSDSASSWGIGANVRKLITICDEITQWKPAAEALYHSLLTATSKVPNSQFVVFTNAGLKQTWQEQAYERVKATA